MNEIIEEPLKYDKILEENLNLLKKICLKVNLLISNKRPIMYSDIINLIIRNELRGEEYTKIIRWCNNKIRKGKIIVNVESL